MPRTRCFVDANDVLADKPTSARPSEGRFSNVIDASEVTMSADRVVLPGTGQSPANDMEVKVLRDGENMKGIVISCPCGRHAELNFEYAPASGDAPPAEPEKGSAT